MKQLKGVDVGKSFAGFARQGCRAEAYMDVLAAFPQKNSRRPRRSKGTSEPCFYTGFESEAFQAGNVQKMSGRGGLARVKSRFIFYYASAGF